VDEFDGSSLDTQRWATCHWWAPDGCTIASNHELEWYVPSQVSVDGGALHLSADRNPVSAGDGRNFAYRSGMISGAPTPGHPGLAFTFGRVEVRARVPAGGGLWPAIWMLPASLGSLPEIDIMEQNGSDPTTVSMHFHYRDKAGSHDLSKHWSSSDLSLDWHTFGVEWSPGRLVWLIDGVERWRVEGAMVPAEPMYIVANLAVGGGSVGAPTAQTVFPSELAIDSIRVWKVAP
jgi:beta-glucanase (GH16 family)